MSDSRQHSTGVQNEDLALLAEFDSQDRLVAAARSMRLAGYSQLDAFTPFPIHALDEALGVRPTRLPWLVLCAGLAGGVAALAFQWWTNTIDYPMLISGKPMFSLPANIPVTFEVIILAAAFAAFFGMLAFNGLPKLSNPVFQVERFAQVTNDGFFLSVAAQKSSLDAATMTAELKRLGAVHVDQIHPSTTADSMPRWIPMVATILGSLALLPPVFIASARSTTSDKPRLHNFFDMDFQPKFKSQTSTTLFADRRSMRPRVRGSVPRGSLQQGSSYNQGIAASDRFDIEALHTKRAYDYDDVSTLEPSWVDEIPVSESMELMERGRERFNIHCAVCHGQAGYGNGLASQRALELEQGTWVPPTSLHAEHVRKQPAGQLFNSITNGIRKMPAYGHQIPIKDRWAIVLYLRALQRSQLASLEDVPAEVRSTLREMN